MKVASADPSTRPLSEVARHLVIPEGIVDSVWFDLEDRFGEWDVEFDAWQDGLGQLLLGVREDGKYASTVGGATLSIPRQVAKTFIVSRTVFALSTLLPDQTALWTAHRGQTATQTFQKLAGFTQRKRVKPYLMPNRNDGLRSTNGEQEILFRNGSRIMFGARERGFGRGFDEVDIEVFDEGQILGERALDDMVPAANQSRNPHGALLIFMGTPPRPVDDGAVFRGRRRKALTGNPADEVVAIRGDALYVECSADPETGLPGGPPIDDEGQIRKANPSFPHRTPQESIDRMRENLPSDDSWRREALGIWDEDEAVGFMPMASWSAGLVGGVPVVTDPVVALDVRTGLDQSFSIGIAGRVDDDHDFVDVLQFEWELRPSRDYIISQVQTWLSRRGLNVVAIDSFGDGNGPLLPLLEAAGVKVLPLNTTDMRNGCVGFRDAVTNGRLLHPANEFLTTAVRGVGTRKSGEGFIFSQDKSTSDVTPLRAVTAAWWALQKATPSTYDVLDSVF